MTESPPLGRMTNSALLPGEHPGIENAIGHRDEIALAHLAFGWCVDESVPEALTANQRDFLEVVCDWDGSHQLGSGESIVMMERIREWISEQALDIEVRSGWYTQGTEPEPEEYRITLSVGGPNLYLVGDLGRYGEPETAKLLYSWYSSPEGLPCIESEAEALVWFACQLVAA